MTRPGSSRCAEAQQILAGLFAAYRDDPGAAAPGMAAGGDADQVATLRAIGDFIAGMTDRYAIANIES